LRQSRLNQNLFSFKAEIKFSNCAFGTSFFRPFFSFFSYRFAIPFFSLLGLILTDFLLFLVPIFVKGYRLGFWGLFFVLDLIFGVHFSP
jgi:hypothetical protein